LVTNERKTVAIILVVKQIKSVKKAVCHASFLAISIVGFFLFNHITIADMLTSVSGKKDCIIIHEKVKTMWFVEKKINNVKTPIFNS
jgi:hypothetical protein